MRKQRNEHSRFFDTKVIDLKFFFSIHLTKNNTETINNRSEQSITDENMLLIVKKEDVSKYENTWHCSTYATRTCNIFVGHIYQIMEVHFCLGQKLLCK